MDDGMGLDRTRPGGGGVPWALVVMIGLAALGFGAYFAMRSGPVPAPVAPPAPEVAATDPLIESGRALYEERCVSCHGAGGRGDGPVAKATGTMVPANLVDADFTYLNELLARLYDIYDTKGNKRGEPNPRSGGDYIRGDDFVRVDLYNLPGRIVVGELTHYPSAGTQVFDPPHLDHRLGALWGERSLMT